jgi:lysozyme
MSQNFDVSAMVEQLIPEESERYFVYDDATGKTILKGSTVVGNPTIGIGRNLAGEGLSDAEARYLCANDVLRVSAELDSDIAWWRGLSPMRQMQIVDMAFNMGEHALVNEWPNFLAAMQAGNWQVAVNELETSLWWQQVGQRGPMIASRILAG